MPAICSPEQAITEADIREDIKLALNKLRGAVIFRNGVVKGLFRPLRGQNLGPAVHINGGLGVGSADLVGLVDGRFFALEIKVPGEKPDPHQEKWLALVRLCGGFAGCATSVAEALACVGRARNGESQ